MRTWMMALAAAAVLGLAGAGGAQADKGPKKKLLVITESKGFRHGCVTRTVTVAKGLDPKDLPKVDGLEVRVSKVKDKAGVEKEKVELFFHGRVPGGKPFELRSADGKVVATVKPAVVEDTFFELAEKTGLFDVVCSQDSRREIVAENLKQFDAVFFYTTGPLPLSDTQKADLLGFIRSGKGFAGSHSATDTFYNWKEYGELIGGYFDGHPWHQKITVIVEDKRHPATKHLGDKFEITDEIYQFKAPYSRKNLHVLMRLDMDSVKNPGKRADKDNALAWTHEVGKGRVFYTALGHRDEVWRDPRFQHHVIGGLRYVFRVD
jgi:type 1 glutamine amidotransferase